MQHIHNIFLSLVIMRIEIVILWQYNKDTIKKGKQHLQSCRKKEVHNNERIENNNRISAFKVG